MKKTEPSIKLSKDEIMKSAVILREYISENFDMDIGNLQSEILLQHITENIGCFYYNKAIEDSISLMTEKTEDLYLLMKVDKK